MKIKDLFLVVGVVLIAVILMLNYQSSASFAQSEAGRYLIASPNSGIYVFDTETGAIYYTGFNVALSKIATVPK